MRPIILFFIAITLSFAATAQHAQKHTVKAKIVYHPFRELDSLLVPWLQQENAKHKKYVYVTLENEGGHIYTVYITSCSEAEILESVKNIITNTNRYILIGSSLIPVYFADYDYGFEKRSEAVFPIVPGTWDGRIIKFDLWHKKIIM
jgi:hypothetical protein